jgi:hypothetical protein
MKPPALGRRLEILTPVVGIEELPLSVMIGLLSEATDHNHVSTQTLAIQSKRVRQLLSATQTWTIQRKK